MKMSPSSLYCHRLKKAHFPKFGKQFPRCRYLLSSWPQCACKRFLLIQTKATLFPGSIPVLFSSGGGGGHGTRSELSGGQGRSQATPELLVKLKLGLSTIICESKRAKNQRPREQKSFFCCLSKTSEIQQKNLFEYVCDSRWHCFSALPHRPSSPQPTSSTPSPPGPPNRKLSSQRYLHGCHGRMKSLSKVFSHAKRRITALQLKKDTDVEKNYNRVTAWFFLLKVLTGI